MPPPTISYALADQSFERTKSLGILNLSRQLAEHLSAALAPSGRLTVFSNASLTPHLRLRAGTAVESFDYAATNPLGRLWWDQWGCLAAAERSRHEWLFLPKGFAPFLRRPRMKIAAYVHDVMPDIYRRRYPGRSSAFEAWYFARSLRATLCRANVIFANTDFTRSEILRIAAEAGLQPPPIVTAGIGFEPSAPWPADRPREGIVALVSSLPHKRTDLALAYLDEWQRSARYAGEIHLIGALPAGLPRPAHPRWNYHPRLEPGAYARLLAQAQALVYFSEYEGFGMPPVEAALAQAAPVFSDLPPTREVMGGCGHAFQNTSADSFAHAMNAALATSPETVRQWAAALLARHSWPSVCQRVLDALTG